MVAAANVSSTSSIIVVVASSYAGLSVNVAGLSVVARSVIAEAELVPLPTV